MNPIHYLKSRSFALPVPNIDTDQIIPARFLTTTTRSGLGRHAFHDWRHRADGTTDPEAALNRIDTATHSILLAGANFGCGSSREHAPWALLDFGVRAVISASIADIFRNNALKNGLLALTVEPPAHARLLDRAGEELTIDLAAQVVRGADGVSVHFAVDSFARQCLLDGVDELGYLLQRLPAIESWEHAACLA